MVKSALITSKKSSETVSRIKFEEKFSRKATDQEAKDYDFITARGTKRRTSSVSESIVFVMRSSLGGGLLTVHVAVLEVGSWTAMALNCGLGFIISYCMYILARSAQNLYGRTHVPSMTYPDVAEAAVLIGPWPRLRKYRMAFRYIVVAMTVIALFGCCYVYQVLMARIIKQLIDQSLSIDDNIQPTTLRSYAVALIVPIMCICMLVTSLANIAPFFMVLMARIIKHLVDQSLSIDDSIQPTTLRTYAAVALIVPIMCICMLVTSLANIAPFCMVLMARIIKHLVDQSLSIDDSIQPTTLRTYAVALIVPIMCICMLVTSLANIAPFCMVLMARIIKQLVDQSLSIDDNIQPTLRTYAVALIVPIMCICMLVTSLTYIAPFCMVADTVYVLITASTAYYGIRTANRTIADMTAFKGMEGLVQYIDTFLFSVQGITATLAIEGNMTNPMKIGIVISTGMFLVILMNAIVGFFGFWGFTENCTTPITVNFPWTPFPIMLKTFTAVTLLVTFAHNFWLPFNLFWYKIKPQIHPDRCKIWENVYRALFVIIITSAAGLVPNVHMPVGIIGSCFLIWLGMIFPAFIHLLVVWENPGLGKLKWRLVTDVSMIICGIIISIVGTIYSIIGTMGYFDSGVVENPDGSTENPDNSTENP